jgi:hypothetical protein
VYQLLTFQIVTSEMGIHYSHFLKGVKSAINPAVVLVGRDFVMTGPLAYIYRPKLPQV